MAKAREAASATKVDVGLQRFYGHVFAVMAFGLALSGGAAFWTMANPAVMKLMVGESGPTMLWFGTLVAELGLVVAITWMMDKVSPTVALVMFSIYAALNGFTFAPVLDLYTQTSVAKVFFITAGTFGGCAFYGYTTKRDLTGFGSFLLIGLIGLIVVSIVNIFLRSPLMDFVICGAGVLIFAGLTAWDMQMLREMYRKRDSGGLVVYGALSLYLDFINLMLYMLRLFGERK